MVHTHIYANKQTQTEMCTWFSTRTRVLQKYMDGNFMFSSIGNNVFRGNIEKVGVLTWSFRLILGSICAYACNIRINILSSYRLVVRHHMLMVIPNI